MEEETVTKNNEWKVWPRRLDAPGADERLEGGSDKDIGGDKGDERRFNKKDTIMNTEGRKKTRFYYSL